MAEDEHITKPKKRQSTLAGSSNYQDNCKKGFNKRRYSQAHHILSLTCMAKRLDQYPDDSEETIDYIEDCLWCTNWDINDGDNLIGLPLNKQFRTQYNRGVWQPINTPSHQVDHNTAKGYTFDVSGYMTKNVWNTLKAKKKIHKVDVETIRTQLCNTSSTFRSRLESGGTYGIRGKGTKYCWEHRFDKKACPAWYKPFSMALTPVPRSPGINLKRLTNIFKKIA